MTGTRAPARTRTVTETQVIPAVPPARAALVAVAAVTAVYAVLLGTALQHSGWAFVLAGAAVVAVEMWLDRRAPIVPWALRRVEFGAPARSLLRGLALAVFAARTTASPVPSVTVLAVAVIVVATIGRVGGAEVLEFARTPPATARGLDVPGAPPPPELPSWLVRPGGAAAVVELIAATGLALSAHTGSAVALLGDVLAALIATVPPVLIGWQLGRLGGLRHRTARKEAVWRALEAYRPEVVVYLGNGVEWRYQLEMWLGTLESVPRRVLAVVRDAEVLRTLVPTPIPVVCVPRAVPVMQMPLGQPPAILYVGNAANNIHFLRRLGTTTVFIGHGDSDKAASSNPFTRVYNEIWVAGQAGRDRYRRSGVDVPDHAFAYVGRPQLPHLPRRSERAREFTVLYAPTWEGWDADTADTSIPVVGPALIRALLAIPGIRVMYRPHPQAGFRDPAVRRANQQILTLLRAAGAQAPPAPGARSLQQWADDYWDAATGHRILTEPAPGLHTCFTATDLLIADISSVVTDWLAADRPYAIVNVSGLADDVFTGQSGTAAGGAVLDVDLERLGAIVEDARSGADPTAAARRAACDYVLGPRTGDPAEPFRRNIERLCGPERRLDGSP